MGRLVLIRHGESEGNRDRVFTRTPDVPLTDRGREQVHDAATRLASAFEIRTIVSSPFLRAVQTAEILARSLAVDLEIDSNLRERHWGALTGRPYGEARAHPEYDPERYWLWRPPGADGETLDEVRERAGAALDRVVRAHPDGDVVVVSHGGVMHALWRHVTGEWRAGRVVDNAASVVVDHLEGRFLATRLG